MERHKYVSLAFWAAERREREASDGGVEAFTVVDLPLPQVDDTAGETSPYSGFGTGWDSEQSDAA